MDRVERIPTRARRARRRARAALGALLACTLSAVALEAVLRLLHHELLPPAISNQVASGYHTGWGGIYAYDPAMNGDYPKPRYTRRMHYNGYRWLHRSDARGFRNAQDREHADVVLLGDSMVYGHGLEQPETIAQQLENALGRPVANLGMQGASIHQEYQILKRWIGSLQPRWVLVFFLYNDIEDLTAYLTHDEMMRFVTAPADERDVAYFDPAARVDPGGVGAILRGSYAARALSILAQLVERRLTAEAHAAPLPALFYRNRNMSLALLFHQIALRRMRLLTEDHGARFVNVLIHTGQPGPEAFYEQVLTRFCRENGIALLSLREPFTSGAAGEALFLERDGHFSAAGARLVAGVVADWIRAHETVTASARAD